MSSSFPEYDFNHVNRGMAIIFWNWKFEKTSGVTDLSEQMAKTDVTRLKVALMTIGFKQDDIKGYENKKAEEMMEIIEKASKENHSASDCFLCVITSHGGYGKIKPGGGQKRVYLTDYIYGTDKAVSLKGLMKPFVSSETLLGKPKIFIVDACRGFKQDKAVSIKDVTGPGDKKLGSDDKKKSARRDTSDHSDVLLQAFVDDKQATHEGSGDVSVPKTLEDSGDAPNQGARENSGDASNPGASEGSGDAPNPGASEDSGEAPNPEASEDSGDVLNLEANEGSGDVSSPGGAGENCAEDEGSVSDATRGRPVPIVQGGYIVGFENSRLPEYIPVWQDYLLFYATQPGFVAFGPETGSPFVRAFQRQISKLGESSMDFLKLLTRVNHDVAFEYQTGSEDYLKKQMPWIACRLTKDIPIRKISGKKETTVQESNTPK